MTALADLVATSAALTATSSRKTKIAALADLLRVLDTDEIAVAVAFLTGVPRQGRIGVGWARVSALQGRATTGSTSIAELDAALTRLEACVGPRSEARRAEIIDELGAAMTDAEAAFVRALL